MIGRAILVATVLFLGSGEPARLVEPATQPAAEETPSWLEPLLTKLEQAHEAAEQEMERVSGGGVVAWPNWNNHPGMWMCEKLFDVWRETGVCLFADVPLEDIIDRIPEVIQRYHDYGFEQDRPPQMEIAMRGIVGCIEAADSHYALTAVHILRTYLLCEIEDDVFAGFSVAEPYRPSNSLRKIERWQKAKGREISPEIRAECLRLDRESRDLLRQPETMPSRFSNNIWQVPSEADRLRLKDKLEYWFGRNCSWLVWDELDERFCVSMPARIDL